MVTPGRTIVVVAAAVLFQAAVATAQDVRVEGVDSLRVRLNLQPQFNTTSADEEPSSEWLMRRARAGLRVWAAGFVRGDLEFGFGKGKAKLTDGYVRLSFGELDVRAGQFKRPFDALELTSSRELLVIERDGAPRGTAGPTPNGLVGDLGHATRDIGAMAEYDFGSGGLSIAAFNGSGDNDSETNDGKQVVARIAGELGGGWTVAGAWSGRREERPIDVLLGGGSDDLTEGVWRNAFEIAVTAGEYAQPGWKALAQVMVGDNEESELGGTSDAAFVAVQGIVAYHVPTYEVPYVIGVEPAGRVGWTDPNDDLDEDEATLWSAGVNLYHHDRVKTQVGVDVLSPAEGDAETAFRIMSVIGF